MSNSPTCSNAPLKPFKLESNLPAKLCVSCNGCFVNLLSYRNWLETYSEDTLSGLSKNVEEVSDTKSALQCPNCNHLMQKFLMGSEASNRVDVCLKCDEAWLDDGEWTLLYQLGLADKLTKITTEPWQSRVKSEKIRNLIQEREVSMFGEADALKVEDFKQWLSSHPQKAKIKKMLNS